MGNGLLEARIEDLITRYRRTMAAALDEREAKLRLETRVAELTEENHRLKEQVDLLGRDRFELKKLKDERKQIRRKLDTALTRVESLERELLS